MERIPLISCRSATLALLLLSQLLATSPNAKCDEPALGSPNPSEQGESNPPNVVTKTLGGLQFWSDVRIKSNWRIQRNVYTGHYRLLDTENKRHAWGTLKHCEQQFTKIAQARQLAPTRGTVVLALHGTVRSRDSMETLCEHLRDKTESTVFNVTYASTRLSIKDHAESLAEIIEHLEGAKEIHLVAHSMGNLVIRHYFGDHLPADKSRQPDPRIRRVVMLAPPNNAPELAKTFKQNPLFQIVWGVSGIEMATWTELEKHLATPTCEFGILAGCMSSVASSNPLIRGNDDLVVAIEETKLAGARDFRKVQVNHSTIMRNDKVLDYTTTFLSRGYFVSPETRQPIEKVVPPAMRDADAPPAALHQRGVTLQRNATPQESERREGEHNLRENNVNRVETKKNEGRARRDGIDE